MIHVWKDERDKPNFEITGQDRGRNILYGHRIDDPKTKVVRVGIAVPTPNKQYLKIQCGKEVYEQEAHSPVLNYYRRVIEVLGGISPIISASFKLRKQDNTLDANDYIPMPTTSSSSIETNSLYGYTSAVNLDTNGIAVGTGNTAWTLDDYKPEILISQGTAAGKLVYSATPSPIISYTGGVWTVLGRRVFDNFNADANTITVKEVVQFAPYFRTSTPATFIYIDERTVLVTQKDIPYKSGAVFTYTRTLTPTSDLTSNGNAILLAHAFYVNNYDAGSVYGAGHRCLKGDTGTVYSASSIYGRWVSYTGSTTYFTEDSNLNGCCAGYGNTDVDPTDYTLGTKYTVGTGEHQLSHNDQNTPSAIYDAGTKTFTVTQSRTLTNSYAGNQVVREIGIVGDFRIISSGTPQRVLVARTVLDSPYVTLAQNESIAIIYDFTMTHP